MRFTFLFLFFLLFSDLTGFADEPDADTIRLSEITIRGRYIDRYSAGSELQGIDSLSLKDFRSFSLNDLIKANAPVHFKSYGNGMLSTVSFRGTGAGHTAVLWNGIQVNQPTVGQSDFSLFPVFAFDEISIHYGASSSRYGSEALGGGILLQSKPDWSVDTPQGQLSFINGSYGKYMGLGKLKIQPVRNLLLQTKVYRNHHRNDFKFKNYTKPGRPIENQQNASLFQYGILQDVYFKSGKHSQFSLNSWFNYAHREIQPSMTNTRAQDTQKDKSLRVSAGYQAETSIGFLEARLGYLRDYLLYNRQSEIITDQYLGQFNFEEEIRNWRFMAGSNYRFITAASENFGGSKNEGRLSLMGGTVYQGVKNTDISFNIRQLYIHGFAAPLSPSLGISHHLWVSQQVKLTFNGQLSQNYRVPTLNDRYWEPGGREDLLPETSTNAESTVTFHYTDAIELKINVAAYHYWVDNWIMWVPGPSYWVPDNVRGVHARGLEFRTSLRLGWGTSIMRLNGNFSFSNSIIKASADENDPGMGNQLPYTPSLLGAAGITWEKGPWVAAAYVDYTGRRFITTGNDSSLPGFLLMNLRAGRNFKIKDQILAVDFKINNIFNTPYENVLYRAMPGRTYTAGIHYLINR